MNDSIVFAVIMFGLIAWVYLAVIEKLHNLSKRRSAFGGYSRAIEALSNLALKHEDTSVGMRMCQCDAHRNARAVIRAYHERGGK